MRETLINIKNRIYSDYLLPNRFHEYEKIIDMAVKKNYIVTSVIDYYDLIKSGAINRETKIIILRHDIDTDEEAARCFFDIEKHYGVKSSFYFRLSTIEPNLMYDIEQYGSEASYHYEEISTFCKQNKITNKAKVFESMSEIQEIFVENYSMIKKDLALPMRSIASHGDFVNRYLGIINNELLTYEIKRFCGIEVEAYDSIIKDECISISDTISPFFWKPYSPIEIVSQNKTKINILTHPRHWRANFSINTKDNLQRLWEGFYYHFL